MLRTFYCGSLRKDDIGKEVDLCGWVFRRRDHGGLIFADLRDVSGIAQVVFSPEISQESHSAAHDLKQEYVIAIKGKVAERPAGTENVNVPTGAVEVLVNSLTVLNTCKPLPFQLEDEEPNESLRLKYRYLDMRRPQMQQIFVQRSQALQVIRQHLVSDGFYEVETPFLTKSTPEGARDFIVPSRLNSGHFYALPQSPQLFKQILMVAGMDRYFQVARCFRDEDLRADRQPEFTQLDLEMSFVDVDDVIGAAERLIKAIFESMTGKPFPLPVRRMDYEEAMEKYGTDKPDLRYDLPMIEVTDVFGESEFGVFRQVAEQKGAIKGIVLKGKQLSRKDLDTAVDAAKDLGSGGLIWMRFEGGKLVSPTVKYLKEAELSGIQQRFALSDGDVLFMMAGKRTDINEMMGRFRTYIAEKYGLIPRDAFAFLWVVNFPLLEYSQEEKRYVARHHPFTAPKQPIANCEGDYDSIQAKAYDMVLNGVEIGGGSIRNYRMEDQAAMFKLLGIKDEVAVEQFGFLLEALEMGAPPHGGIAFGFDRILMMLLKLDSIRDVIPFPKTQKGACLMSGAPGRISQRQMNELKIRTAKE
ncbi:MAG TPA: aspartate--tRNA ligase [Deltaproteobacteria bacterium]|nr:aspartate--tRNA ligase [Deltaproteobacteria bacterium]